MANPTTNYGFVLPTSSDLVTDLPADFDVALQGVDTRLKALQPGTTTGDLAYSSATANTNTRLGIGTTGQVLVVAGGVPTWGSASAVPDNFSLLNGPSGTALTGATEITVSGISNIDRIAVIITGASSANASSVISLRINGANPTTTAGGLFKAETNYAAGNQSFADSARFAEMAGNAGSVVRGFAMIEGCNSAGTKVFTIVGGAGVAGGGTGNSGHYAGGFYTTSSTVSSVGVLSSTGNFDAGTIFVYGSA